MENKIKNTLFRIDHDLDELYLSIRDNNFTTDNKHILWCLSMIESNISKIRISLVETGEESHE
ncbi:MAG: hypothetical protein J6D12_01770 [Peptostreptococcaceae bacterium]|nr:hypothetical protein [Peptostreptococcaceae bacterium]